MCIRDRSTRAGQGRQLGQSFQHRELVLNGEAMSRIVGLGAVSYTHLRAHETVLDLVCRLLLEQKKKVH